MTNSNTLLSSLKISIKISVKISIISILLITTFVAKANDVWYFTFNPKVISGSFSNSLTKKSLTTTGLTVDISYLEKASLALNYSSVTIGLDPKYKTAEQNAQKEDIEQSSISSSLKYNFYTDQSGIITTRLDYHTISNNDVTGNTDNVVAIAPMLSWLSATKTYYLDVGLAQTDYPSKESEDNALEISQFVATVGYGFYSNWLQLRAYSIKSSNSLRSQNATNFVAIEAHWTHWYEDNFLAINSTKIAALTGKRMFAVDYDTGSVYNVADEQTGSFSFAVDWKLYDNASLLLSYSLEQYATQNITTQTKKNYTGNFVYAGFTYIW